MNVIDRKELRSYGVVSLASILYGVAFDWFYIPNAFSFGGVSGISQIINYYLPDLPIGGMTIAFNVPLFLVGFKKFGFRFLLRSLYCMLATSVLIDAVQLVHTFSPLDPMLACVCGGVLMGIATGTFFLEGTTGGGTELGAWIIKDKVGNFSLGRICLIIDVAVIIAFALVFGAYQNALYGILAMYISTSITDAIVYGGNAAKLTYIISDRQEDIREMLLNSHIGVTVLGVSSADAETQTVLLCAIRKSSLLTVKGLVCQMDPNAFLILCDAQEVLGNKFSKNETA